MNETGGASSVDAHDLKPFPSGLRMVIHDRNNRQTQLSWFCSGLKRRGQQRQVCQVSLLLGLLRHPEDGMLHLLRLEREGEGFVLVEAPPRGEVEWNVRVIVTGGRCDA